MGIRYALPLRMTLISRPQIRLRIVQMGQEQYLAACGMVSRRGTIDCPSEPEDESLIDIASHYKHPESSAETEGRREHATKSGVTDEVQ